MKPHAVTVEVLPAAYGDCLLVTCAAPALPRGEWRMLVDTGPDDVYPRLRERLARLPTDERGRRHVDLFVVTHIDHDHIGGARRLIGDPSLNLEFGDVWFNAPVVPRVRGVAEGEALAKLLGAGSVPLPWNRAFDGQAAATPGEGEVLEVPQPAGGPRITMLSPSPKRLEALFKVWDRELERLAHPPEPAAPRVRGAPEEIVASLESLAGRASASDRAPANGSSIAFLLEHEGVSILFAADAFAAVLVPALASLAQRRSLPAPMRLDAIKLSHHGSRANVTNALFDVVQARHYVFSTNGAIFDHPDDEAVARTVLHGGPQPVLWFNYANPRTRRWSALGPRHGFEARYPQEGQEGVVLELPG